jgi:hypothetical protein
MGEVANEARPRPFHERFDIPLPDTEAQRRFMNRLNTLLLDEVYEDLEVAGVDLDELDRDLAYVLGETSMPGLRPYIGGDFHRFLQVVESMYQLVREPDIREVWSAAILRVIADSEVDLGISWQPPIFVRTGARLLDERLVNEPLRWLLAPRYESVLRPFEKGLSHYLEASEKPERLADTITDMYEAIEALARIETRRNRDLSGNRELFISSVGASDYYKQLLKDYIAYANQYRHAAQSDKPNHSFPNPKESRSST